MLPLKSKVNKQLMKKKTLLEIAKEQKASRKRVVATEEKIEVAIAWMKGEITTRQVSIAFYGGKEISGTVLYRICILLREANTRGIIKL